MVSKKNAADSIAQQLKEYRHLFNTAADPAIIIDPKGYILECNQTLLQVYGYTKKEIIGKDVSFLHHPSEDMDKVFKDIKGDKGKIVPHIYLHKTKNKKRFPVEVCTSRITFKGKPAQFSNIRDITERKKTQDVLQESEKRFRLAFDSSAVGKALSLVNGPFFLVNQRMCDMFGYAADELIGTMATSLTHPDDLEMSRAAIKDIYSKNSKTDAFTLEKRYLSKAGQVIWMNTTVTKLKDEKGKPLYMFVEFVDITIRKNAEETTRQLRNYLSNIINSMPSILVGVTPDGEITQWNKKAEIETGFSEESVMGKGLSQLFPHFKNQIKNIKTAIYMRKIQKEAKIPRQTGKETVFEDLTIYPLISNGVEGAVIRIDDVTEQVRIEEMIMQSEKMMSVGGLAAGMAHEINNPLAGIMQNTQVVISRLTKSLAVNENAATKAGTRFDVIKEYMEQRDIIKLLEMIHSSGSRAAKIVQNMLSFVRKNSSQKMPCNIVRLIKHTLELAYSDYDIKKGYDFRKINITEHYDDNLPSVYCEESKIQQVVLNLLKNAAQALYDSPQKLHTPPKINIDVHHTTPFVNISIRDNGPGMDSETKKRIFEPFFTTKKPGKGTGLGLSVSYFIIVEDHGGQMNVESFVGKGTTFLFRLKTDAPK